MRRLVLGAALSVALATVGPASAQPAPTPPAGPPAAPVPAAPAAPGAATPGSPVDPAGPRPPLSESLTGEAKADYDAARILFGAGDFAGARVKFLRAHEVSNDARLLWNAAACDKNLRRYARVEALVERYVADSGPALPEEDRAEAQALLDTVRSFISDLRVEGPPGATVLVDDEPKGTLPLAKPLRVDLGRHAVVVRQEGFHDFQRTEVFDGRTAVVLQATLAAIVREGRVTIEAPQGATISIDGRPVGQGRFEGALPAGPHQIRVTADGTKPHEASVDLRAGETRSLSITLQPLSTDDGPGAWPWVIAGGVVVTGAAIVGGYFLFSSDFEPVGGTIADVSLGGQAWGAGAPRGLGTWSF